MCVCGGGLGMGERAKERLSRKRDCGGRPTTAPTPAAHPRRPGGVPTPHSLSPSSPYPLHHHQKKTHARHLAGRALDVVRVAVDQPPGGQADGEGRGRRGRGLPVEGLHGWFGGKVGGGSCVCVGCVCVGCVCVAVSVMVMVREEKKKKKPQGGLGAKGGESPGVGASLLFAFPPPHRARRGPSPIPCPGHNWVSCSAGAAMRGTLMGGPGLGRRRRRRLKEGATPAGRKSARPHSHQAPSAHTPGVAAAWLEQPGARAACLALLMARVAQSTTRARPPPPRPPLVSRTGE